jgi:hypothetical protein
LFKKFSLVVEKDKLIRSSESSKEDASKFYEPAEERVTYVNRELWERTSYKIGFELGF